MKDLIPRYANADWYTRQKHDPRVYVTGGIAEAARQIQWTAVPIAESSIEKQVAEGRFDLNPRLSFRELMETAVDLAESRLVEATSETAQAQLLRVGAASLSYGWYLQWGTTWQEFCAQHQMTNLNAIHNPLQATAMPSRTGPQTTWRRSKIKGLNIEHIALKIMGGVDIENELYEDDQSGQIGDYMKHLGWAAARFEDAYSAGRVNGAAFSLGDMPEDAYPATSYAWTNHQGTSGTGPYNVNRYATGLGNRPAAFGVLEYGRFVFAYNSLLQARDISGQKLMIRPDTLVHSTTDKLNADVLLKSSYLAYIAGRAGATAATAPTSQIGGQFSINAVSNYVNRSVCNIYLQPWEWYLCEAKRGLVFNRRTPVEIMQEAPNAGRSFREDITSYRSRMRMEVDWLDSSFWFQGNDGSAVGTF